MVVNRCDTMTLYHIPFNPHHHHLRCSEVGVSLLTLLLLLLLSRARGGARSVDGPSPSLTGEAAQLHTQSISEGDGSEKCGTALGGALLLHTNL